MLPTPLLVLRGRKPPYVSKPIISSAIIDTLVLDRRFVTTAFPPAIKDYSYTTATCLIISSLDINELFDISQLYMHHQMKSAYVYRAQGIGLLLFLYARLRPDISNIATYIVVKGDKNTKQFQRFVSVNPSF